MANGDPVLVALGPGALDLARAARADATRRGLVLPVLAFAHPPPPPIAAPPPGSGVTRSAAEFARIELKPRPVRPPPPPLPAEDVVAPPMVTTQALLAALEQAPAGALPPRLAGDPAGWLARLGEPPRGDAWAFRLLFARAEAGFTRALDRVLTAGAQAFVLADPGDAIAAGALVPVLDLLAARRSDGVALLAAGGERQDGGRAELLAELEARAEPVVLLAASLGPAALLDLLLRGNPGLARRPGSFRGHPLAFAVARAAAIEADVPGAEWERGRDAVAAALDRLVAREPFDAEAEVASLEAEIPLPGFAAVALKPLADLVRDLKAPPFPAAPPGEDPAVSRRRLDALLGRRREEIGDRETRLAGETLEWLHGGKLSLLGGKRTPGFLPLVAARVRRLLAERGAAAALAFLAAATARIGARETGAVPQLKARIQEAEHRRALAAPGARGDSLGLAGILGRKDAPPRPGTARPLGEYVRLTGEVVALAEAAALASAGQDLLDRAREAVAATASEVTGLRDGAAVARTALGEPAAAGPAPGARELLARALEGGALTRWAATPQAMVDDLWSLAKAPLTGQGLLAAIDAPGERLAAALEAVPPPWRRETLPRRLWPEPRATLVAPGDALARRAAGGLALAPAVTVEPHGDSIRLLLVEAGLPYCALAEGPEPPARGGEAWAALLAATLGAGDLAALAQSGGALSRAEALAGPGTAEEVAVLLALEPAVLALAKAREVTDAESRVHYLEQARQVLEAWTETAAAGLVEPERGLALAAGARWRGQIDRSLAGARGRADLRIRLRTRRLGLTGSAVRIEAELTVAGNVPATNVTLTLEPGERHRVLGEGRVGLGRLPAGSSATLGFHIRPPGPGPLALRFVARWDDLTGPGNETALEDAIELHEVRAGFRRLESNPYIAGPPVRAENMFFGRADIFAFVRDNLRGRHQNNVLLLHGNRRTGKSSLLYQLERGSHVAPFLPVYLDLQGLGRLSTASLFAALARKMSRALAGSGREAPVAPAREAFEAGDAFDRMNDWLDAIESAPWNPPPILVMLDEFEILEDKAREGRVDPELFGWLRAKMQHSEKVAFLLAGTHRLSELDPALWSPLLALCLYRHVSFLGEAETRDLVTRPVAGELDFDDLALEAILRLTAGHPYYVQLLCQLLVGWMNECARSNVVTLDDINAAAARLLEAGGGQFTCEWNAPRRSASRLVLAALAEAADSAAGWVGLDEVVARTGLAPAAAEEGARELVDRDLALGSGGSFRVRIDLFRQWLRRERPVGRARAEASG